MWIFNDNQAFIFATQVIMIDFVYVLNASLLTATIFLVAKYQIYLVLINNRRKFWQYHEAVSFKIYTFLLIWTQSDISFILFTIRVKIIKINRIHIFVSVFDEFINLSINKILNIIKKKKQNCHMTI